MHYNVFQPVGNAFQRAEIIFECVGNILQCVGNVHQRVEQRIANFINVLRLRIDCFVCHANQRPSINKTLLQVLGLCLPKLLSDIRQNVSQRFTNPWYTNYMTAGK